jgi:hypothetical protein
MTEAYDKVQLLRGKLNDWFTINPILDEGEAAVVFDTETNVPIGIKAGNGELHFRDLPFMGAGSFTTYTKEEIDTLFKESNEKIGILQLKVDALYQIIPSSATPSNKLITLKELTEPESPLQKIVEELTQNKLDKSIEVTTLDKAYIKKADGSQDLIDVTNETTASSEGIAARRAGRIKTRRASENDDAVNNEDLQAVKTDLEAKKLSKIDVQDNDEYLYAQDKSSSKLLRVEDDVIPNVVVKRTSTGTIKSSKATQASEVVILEQLQDVSTNLDAHEKDVSNPHKVTKAQIGLSNVDNTADLVKPISTAVQDALNKKQNTILGTSDSSSYILQPPISDGGDPVRKAVKDFASAADLEQEKILRKQADDEKVDKKEGYDLSQNDFTNALKKTYDDTVYKVSGIAPNAQVNVLERIVLFGKEVPIAGKRVILTGIAQSQSLSEEESNRIAADNKLSESIQTNTKSINDESTTRKSADDTLSNRIDKIAEVVPEQASKINLLADRDFVNSSITSSTATFMGTYASLEDLKTEATQAKKNDYAYVRSVTNVNNQDTYIFIRYKYEGELIDPYNPEEWVYEYTINNSGFTAEQWAAINSGITATLKDQITTNKNQISTNSRDIDLLKNSKVDAVTYTADITELRNAVDTKELSTINKILNWFNQEDHAWAKLAGVNVPLQEIRGKNYTNEFYSSYIDNLRALQIGSQVPYDADSWTNIIAKEDSSENIWVFVQKLGLFYEIVVDDATKEILFFEKPIYSLAGLSDLTATKDQIEADFDNKLDTEIKKCVKSSDKTEQIDSYKVAIYDNTGKLLESKLEIGKVGSIELVTERWKAIRYVKGDVNLTEYYQNGTIYLDRLLSNPQTPKNEIYSGITYIDSGETSGNVMFALTDEASLSDIKLPNSIDVSLCRSTGTESPLILENSSLSLLLFSTRAKDASNITVWASIDDITFINCDITLTNPSNKQDTSASKVYRLSNSRMSINASNFSSSSTLTFDKVEYSRIDIDDRTKTSNRYIFKDVISSVVYLHHDARIKIDVQTENTSHAQELEIVLCADYNPNAKIAVGDATCPFTGTGRPVKITDLRKPVYSSRSYVAVIVEDDTKDFQKLPKQLWSDAPDATGEYYTVINYNTHRCGSMPDLYNSTSKLNYFFPKVKTYSLVNEAIFEEVYDSAQIDINSGDVTLRSKSRTPIYLVVIS